MSSWGQGTTWGWRKARQVVLERDAFECQLRYDCCTFSATEVHHTGGLHGLSRAEAVDPETCVAVCSPCHAKVTARQSVAAQQRLNAVRAARKKLPQQPHPGET